MPNRKKDLSCSLENHAYAWQKFITMGLIFHLKSGVDSWKISDISWIIGTCPKHIDEYLWIDNKFSFPNNR